MEFFFSRDEFYSTTVRILYAELKMRNMSNVNDWHNEQYLILFNESFRANKRDDVKVICNIKLNNEKHFQRRRITIKILKIHENNQYGFVMAKPMPTGYIKKKPQLLWRTFSLLIEAVSLDDPIGHLFIVDIKFDHGKATKKQILYNEVLPPVIEKQNILEANEKSIYQLLEQYQKTNSGIPKAYRCTKKSHTMLFAKKFVPLYLEEIKFLIQRCGWLVTKIYSHFTFEQDMFKTEFVLHNQKEQQDAKTDIEKDFYKLMNNANFGVDCRNNLNNSTFKPIIDKINEVSYLKRCYNLFDKKISNFINSDVLEKEIEFKFDQKYADIKKDDSFKAVKITIKNEKSDEVDARNAFKKKWKKIKEEKKNKS